MSREWESRNGVAKIKNSGVYVMGIPKGVRNKLKKIVRNK